MRWSSPHHSSPFVGCKSLYDRNALTSVSSCAGDTTMDPVVSSRNFSTPAAEARGCKSEGLLEVQKLKETKVWGTDGMDSMSKTHWWRDLPYVFVRATHNQPERRDAREALGLLSFAQVSSEFRRVLEKPSVLLLVHPAAWVPCLTTSWTCNSRTKAATPQGRRNLLMPQSPTSSSCS